MQLSEDPFINSWLERIQLSNESFEKWQKKFKCETLEKYYEGLQTQEDQSYSLNLIASTWETKKPALLFKRPNYSFEPEPFGRDFNPDDAFQKSLLASDMVNSLVKNPKIKFAANCAMSLLDSGAYFGVIEVGYSGNWESNPNAPKPIVNRDYDPNVQKTRKKESPTDFPEEEWIYAKRIEASNFRVGGDIEWDLEANNWVGYFEWFRCQDLRYREEGGLDKTSPRDPYSEPSGVYGESRPSGYAKLWKIWDLRKKTFFILNETEKTIELKEASFKRLPIFDLRFSMRRKGFYPVPLFFNWKPAQDDYNEARTQLRSHRRRSKRAYQALKGQVSPEEIEKLVNLPDGVVIEVKQRDALSPINHGSADPSIVQSLQLSKDDFNIASGTSAEARGQADRVTATQAGITARYAGIREKSEQEVVAEWLNAIGREILYQAVDNFTLPMWIQRLSDSPNTVGEEAQVISYRYELIQAEMLKGYKYNCNVSVDSLSPLTSDEEKQKFMEFLAIINQYPVYSLHPTIIREMAFRLGYRNEQVIQAMQQMGQLQLMQQVAQGQENLAAGQTGVAQNQGMSPPIGGGVAQKTVEQMQPPDQGQIENQLANQGVPQRVS